MARQPTTDRTASAEIARLREEVRQLQARFGLGGTVVTGEPGGDIVEEEAP